MKNVGHSHIRPLRKWTIEKLATLYKLRHEQKLAQETVAERLGFHKSSIRAMERDLGWTKGAPKSLIEAKEDIFALLSTHR